MPCQNSGPVDMTMDVAAGATVPATLRPMNEHAMGMINEISDSKGDVGRNTGGALAGLRR